MADPGKLHLNIGILTHRRLDHLRRCINSILATVNIDTTITVLFDDDEPSYQSLDHPIVNKALVAPRHYYVRGMNRLYAVMEHAATTAGKDFDWLCFLNDDVEFLHHGWPLIIIESMIAKWGDGVGVAEMVAPEKCAHYITRKRFLDQFTEYQRPANPIFTMYYSDSDLMCCAKDAGRYAFLSAPGKGPVVLHHIVHDTLRAECSRWRTVDKVEWQRRAEAKGWA